MGNWWMPASNRHVAQACGSAELFGRGDRKLFQGKIKAPQVLEGQETGTRELRLPGCGKVLQQLDKPQGAKDMRITITIPGGSERTERIRARQILYQRAMFCQRRGDRAKAEELLKELDKLKEEQK